MGFTVDHLLCWLTRASPRWPRSSAKGLPGTREAGVGWTSDCHVRPPVPALPLRGVWFRAAVAAWAGVMEPVASTLGSYDAQESPCSASTWGSQLEL